MMAGTEARPTKKKQEPRRGGVTPPLQLATGH